MIITQTFTMARWEIDVKKSEAVKQTKDQNNNKTKNKNRNKTSKNKQTNKQNMSRGVGGGGGAWVKKQITNRMLS